MHHPEETFLQHGGMILINDDDNDDDNGGMMVSPGLRYETGSIGGKNGGIKTRINDIKTRQHIC